MLSSYNALKSRADELKICCFRRNKTIERMEDNIAECFHKLKGRKVSYQNINSNIYKKKH